MIYLAGDHRGFNLKEKIKNWLKEWGYEFEDFGAYNSDDEDDYPDFVHKVARVISGDPENNKGIILGATGQGEAMVANRYNKVRAMVYYGGPEEIIKMSREHNNSNILSIGTSFIDENQIKNSIKVWLDLEFSGEERHLRRIEKIDK